MYQKFKTAFVNTDITKRIVHALGASTNLCCIVHIASVNEKINIGLTSKFCISK